MIRKGLLLNISFLDDIKYLRYFIRLDFNSFYSSGRRFESQLVTDGFCIVRAYLPSTSSVESSLKTRVNLPPIWFHPDFPLFDDENDNEFHKETVECVRAYFRNNNCKLRSLAIFIRLPTSIILWLYLTEFLKK